MIVRINELDVARAESAADWGACPRRGPLRYDWARSAHAYEVLVLDRDEQNKVLTPSFRQNQVRHLLPETIAALSEEGEETVLRLDGVLAPGELLHALSVVSSASWSGRFALSDAGRYSSGSEPVVASLRTQPGPAQMTSFLGDPELALDRSVRLRAFGVAPSLVQSVLAIGPVDDDRWNDVLPQAGFLVGTSRGLRSIYIVTPRLDAAAFKSRLTQRLLAAARAAQPVASRV